MIWFILLDLTNISQICVTLFSTKYAMSHTDFLVFNPKCFYTLKDNSDFTYFIYLFSVISKADRQMKESLSSNWHFTFKCYSNQAMARSRPAESTVQARSCMWMAEPPKHEPRWLPPRMHVTRKLWPEDMPGFRSIVLIWTWTLDISINIGEAALSVRLIS